MAMIRNGRIYRNLEEQVLKNMDDIEELKQQVITEVIANPEEAATDSLQKLKVGETVYSIEGEAGDVEWGDIEGTLADQTDLKNALDAKQDKLIPGANITIVDNVISASGQLSSAAWGQITGTLSDQTDLKNALDAKQDLIDSSHKLPASNVSGLSAVATTGDYDDLSNKPTIPAAQVQSDYTQSDSTAVDYIKNKPDLSIYAQSASLSPVATSGSYNDLTNKPSIPAAQVQSDWNQTDSSAVDYIKNKPTIPVSTDTWRPVKVNGVQKLDSQTTGNPLDLVAGTNVTLSESNGQVTISATGGGATYTAGNGIDITSNVISLQYPSIIILGEND